MGDPSLSRLVLPFQAQMIPSGRTLTFEEAAERLRSSGVRIQRSYPGAPCAIRWTIFYRKALPGGWEAQDDSAYALVFETGVPVEDALPAVTLKRLQEALPFPIPDSWAKRLWDYGLDEDYIQRLETDGDCRGEVRIDLTKPWQDLVQNLLDREILVV
jgi:hypothetical protein